MSVTEEKFQHGYFVRVVILYICTHVLCKLSESRKDTRCIFILTAGSYAVESFEIDRYSTALDSCPSIIQLLANPKQNHAASESTVSNL